MGNALHGQICPPFTACPMKELKTAHGYEQMEQSVHVPRSGREVKNGNSNEDARWRGSDVG